MLLYSAAFQKNVAATIAMKKCVEMATCLDLKVIYVNLKVNRLYLRDFDQFIWKQSKNRTKQFFSEL